MSELSLGLQSGDVWVQGSQRYRKFESYLIEPAVWVKYKDRFLHDAAPSLDCDAYLSTRKNLLGQQMQKVAEMIGKHLLPEARMEGNRLEPAERLCFSCRWRFNAC